MKRAGNTDMALGYMRTMKEIMALEGEMTLDEFDSSYPAPDFVMSKYFVNLGEWL